MTSTNSDLHGSAPDKSPVALLLIDLINDFDFPEGDQLLQHTLPAAERIAALKRRAAEHRVPTVYVNDNFGRWRSDFRALIENCLKPTCKGRPVVELLRPDPDDYFVLKPKHSGFFSTTLDLLLRYLGVRNVILTGVAGNNCVLFTANDAYMRDLKLFVPSDCIASNTPKDNEFALHQMQVVLKADVQHSAELDFASLIKSAI